MENSSLNTYKIVRKLGEGGGGIVYLAYHTRLQKQVVKERKAHRIGLRGGCSWRYSHRCTN